MRKGTDNRLLGWKQILAGIEARTKTLFGREQALSILPLSSKEDVQDRLAELEAIRKLNRMGEFSPLAEIPDVRRNLVRVEKEGILDGSSLREVAHALHAGADLAHFLRRHRETLGSLADRWSDLGGGETLAKKIDRSIDPSGEVTDEASPMVLDARNRMRALHTKLRKTAEDMTRSKEWADKLQEPYFSVRGDRYVLPVKAAWRYQLGGIVHNVSNTGETVFIEPPALISLGNDLAIAISEEEEAVRMVLAELTRLVGDRRESILNDIASIGFFDMLDATARMSEDLDSSPPDIAGDAGVLFDLKAVRHPLLVLQGKKVIENDIRLESDTRSLVVSGPNAGGKTVTITAVALCSLMLRHGMPIPAAPNSLLPLYDEVLAVLGDEQDLERDLSTFSAHLQSLKEVVEDAAPNVLIVVDEICADTDPKEGSALAAALLEKLLDKGAHILVTTHFEALKALAAANPRYLAAAVGFDVDKMQPTYRLRLNVSGSSSAIEIAARTGLPEDVLQNARAHLSGDGGALSSALGALEAGAQRADAEAKRLRELQEEARQQNAKLEEMQAKLKEEIVRVRKEARAELIREIDDARKEVKATLASLQAQPSMKKVAETEKELENVHGAALTQEAREEEECQSAEEDDVKAPRKIREESFESEGSIQPGSFVRAPTLGDREGEVLSVDDKSAHIAFGALKMRLPIDRLVLLKRAPRKAVSARMASSDSERAAKSKKMRAEPVGSGGAETTIDLRGMRVEDAIDMLDKRLDELLSDGVARVRVIHGHGTGALRKSIREHLAISPHVAGTEVPPEDYGGDGATWVRLDI